MRQTLLPPVSRLPTCTPFTLILFPRFHSAFCILHSAFCLLVFPFSAEAALTVVVRDRAANPLPSVSVQLFPGTVTPDSQIEPIKPNTPRADGLVGFVTNAQGRVTVDVPAGRYTVVAFSDNTALGRQSFFIRREANAPGEIELSLSNTAPVTVRAVNAQGNPLETARVAFRPAQRTLGFVGLLNNNGELRTAVSPGQYHVVIKGSIAQHYVVLTDQTVTAGGNTLRFDGASTPTARLRLNLPRDTGLALYEVLGTQITSEFVDVVENEIGYDAAYTDVYGLALGTNAQPLNLQTGLTYRLNLSYLVPLNSTFYAYELRINALTVDAPRDYFVGNDGQQAFRLTAQTERSEYLPGQDVTVSYEILDTRGNQLYRLFNFGAARLLFPFVVVKDPDGVVVASNPITSELPEDFFRFRFRLPEAVSPGLYTVNVSLDAKMYGILSDTRTFRVRYETEQTPPRITNIEAPENAEINAQVRLRAQVTDTSGLSAVTLRIGSETSPRQPTLLPNNRYEWLFDTGREAGAALEWRITATDTFNNVATASGRVVVQDTTPPVIVHTPPSAAEIGVALPVVATVTDNGQLAEVSVAYRNDAMADFSTLRLDGPPFQTTIPGAALTGNSLRYFITAQDGVGNVVRLPQTGVFEAQLRDTTPPRIFHTPADDALDIEAVVVDNNAVAEARIGYRENGGGIFSSLALREVAPGTYAGRLPASATAYFLEAEDRDGNRARLPAEDGSYGIAPRRVESLTVFPTSTESQPLEIRVGSELKFELQAVDTDGQPVHAIPIWSVTNGVGEIDMDGRFFAATHAGRAGKVIATLPVLDGDAAMQAEAWVRLTPGAPNRLIVLPDGQESLILPAGAQQSFQAVVSDSFGNLRSDAVNWRVEGGIGTMTGSRFRAQHGVEASATVLALRSTEGAGRVVATSGGLETVVPIEVSFGQLTRIEITPTSLSLRAGERQTVRAFGVDTQGNRVPLAPVWSVNGGVGRARNGDFIASRMGEGTLTAAVVDIAATIPVTAQPGLLRTITTEPFVAYLPVSTARTTFRRQYIALGWDIAGNPIPINNLRWTVDAGAGTIDATGLMQSVNEANPQAIGNVVINGTAWAFGQDENGRNVIPGKSVVVIQAKPPGPIERLVVTPKNFDQPLARLTLAVGETQQFEATGFDSQQRQTPVSPSWSVVGDIGVIQRDGLFVATRPGLGTVIASDSGQTGHLSVEVTHGLLDTLAITPPVLALTSNQSFRLGLAGSDLYGNPVSLEGSVVAWRLLDGNAVATLDASGQLTAIRPGTGRIEARVGDVSTQAQLFVYPVPRMETVFTDLSPISNLQSSIFNPIKVHPSPLQLEVGRAQQFRAYWRDSQGQHVALNQPSWSITNGLGTITADGVFSAVQTGVGHVVVSSEGAVGKAYLAVVGEMGNLEALLIVPQEAITLTVGDRQVFYTLGIYNPQSERVLPFGKGELEGVSSPSELAPVLATWQISGGIGTIDAMGHFTATTQGQGEVRASLGGMSVSCPVIVRTAESRTVEAPPPDMEITRFGQPGRAFVAFHVTPEATQVRAGDSAQFTAFGVDSEGNRSQAYPSWELRGDAALGRMQPDGRFFANRVGTGRIVASLQGSNLPAQQITLEVTPSRAQFAQLEPAELIIQGRSESIPITLVAYDWRGNRVSLPSGNVSWRVVGDVGTLRANGGTATFEPVSETTIDQTGEVIATLPSANLVGRARVRRYATTTPIVEAHIVPDSVELAAGERIQLGWVARDSAGRVVPSTPRWEVININTDAATVSQSGLLTTTPNATAGETFQVTATLDSLRAESQIRIVSPLPERIEIENLSGRSRLAIGERIGLRAVGWDRFGSRVTLQPKWSILPNVGELVANATTPSEATLTATATGSGLVRVTQGSVFAVLPVTVNASTTDTLLITVEGVPATEPLQLKAGGVVTLEAFSGETRTSPVWSIEGAQIGEISADGRLTARRVGEVAVVATVEGRSAQVQVEVVPGDIAALRVEPRLVSLLSGTASQVFSVTPLDLYGNTVPRNGLPIDWLVTGGIGAIDDSGRFTPLPVTSGKAVTGTVVAAAAGIYGSASVTIVSERGDLAALEIRPDSTRVAAGQGVDIEVLGRDSNGNLLPSIDLPLTLAVSPAIGELEGDGAAWRYRAPTELSALSVRLQAQAGDVVSPPIDLSLVPGALAAFDLSPATVTLEAGDTQTFTLEATDAFSNTIPLESLTVPPSWSVSPPLGELQSVSPSGATYRAVQVGTTQLNVRVGNITAASEITVTPGNLTRLSIEPSTVRIAAGETVVFRTIGQDAFGNPVADLPATWEVIGFGDGTPLQPSPDNPHQRVWKPEKAGKGRIEARFNSLVAQVQVEVTTGDVVSLEITLSDDAGALQPPYTLTSGATYTLGAVGRDAFGNPIDVNVSWQLAGNLGRIITGGEEASQLEAIFVGEGNLIASAGNLTREAVITVQPSSARVGAAGGQIESPTGLRLNIPSRAVTTEQRIDIAIIESPGTTQDAQRITRVVEIRPRKLVLKRPAELIFSYARPIVSEFDPAKLSLYFWDEFQEKWVRTSSRTDVESQQVYATVNHFAPYAVMESEQLVPPSDEFRIDQVRLSPPVLYAPEANRLTVEYVIRGPRDGEVNVTIEIFDLRDRRVITLLGDVPRRMGRNAEQWDGRAESGELVRNGRYIVLLTAKTPDKTVGAKALLVVFK